MAERSYYCEHCGVQVRSGEEHMCPELMEKRIEDLEAQLADYGNAFLIASVNEKGNQDIRVGLAFDDPFEFGVFMVDIIRTIALSYQRTENASSSSRYLDRMKEGLDAEWENKTTVIGFREERKTS